MWSASSRTTPAAIARPPRAQFPTRVRRVSSWWSSCSTARLSGAARTIWCAGKATTPRMTRGSPSTTWPIVQNVSRSTRPPPTRDARVAPRSVCRLLLPQRPRRPGRAQDRPSGHLMSPWLPPLPLFLRQVGLLVLGALRWQGLPSCTGGRRRAGSWDGWLGSRLRRLTPTSFATDGLARSFRATSTRCSTRAHTEHAGTSWPALRRLLLPEACYRQRLDGPGRIGARIRLFLLLKRACPVASAAGRGRSI